MFAFSNTKVNVIHYAKPNYDLNPINVANELLKDMKIGGRPGIGDPFRKQIMLSVTQINLQPSRRGSTN